MQKQSALLFVGEHVFLVTRVQGAWEKENPVRTMKNAIQYPLLLGGLYHSSPDMASCQSVAAEKTLMAAPDPLNAGVLI